MSDTPDVLDAIDMVLEPWIDIENVERVRDGLLRVFTEQQLAVVKADGLSHGDELVRYGRQGGIVGGGQVYVKWAPKNGDTQ